MDNILGRNLYLLEANKNWCKLSFTKELNSLEFVEIIGNMDIIHLIDYNKRDIFLKNLGKQLFKKHPIKKTRKNKIYFEIRHETRIYSQEEIDSLLWHNKTPVYKKIIDKIKQFYRNICEWKLTIYFYKNAVKYKISLNEIKKIDYNIHKKEFMRKNNNKNKISEKEVLSQQEIDMLLTPINNNNEVLSQKEIDQLLTVINNNSENK